MQLGLLQLFFLLQLKISDLVLDALREFDALITDFVYLLWGFRAEVCLTLGLLLRQDFGLLLLSGLNPSIHLIIIELVLRLDLLLFFGVDDVNV